MSFAGALGMLGETTGWVCRGCGCTDQRACVAVMDDGPPVPCHWAAPNLCSACAPEHPCELCSGPILPTERHYEPTKPGPSGRRWHEDCADPDAIERDEIYLVAPTAKLED